MIAHSLTLLLTEVLGGTAVRERLGDAEAQQALERCQNRINRALEVHGGRIIDSAERTLVAILPSVEAAGEAALDMQQRLAALPPLAGQKMAIRVVIHAAIPGEAIDEPAPQALADARRMLALATAGETVTTSVVLGRLSARLANGWHPLPPAEGLAGFSLYRQGGVTLPPPSPSPVVTAVTAPMASVVSDMAKPALGRSGLHIRYHGQSFLVDERSPTLTLGRDPRCKLVVAERKASRQHARIERRGQDYYLVDTSTNGSFVSIAGQREILIRRHEIQLTGQGLICFGASINDPAADRAEFECQA